MAGKMKKGKDGREGRGWIFVFGCSPVHGDWLIGLLVCKLGYPRIVCLIVTQID